MADNSVEILIAGTRALLNDYAMRNKLLGQVEEYTDDEIIAAIETTLQEINYGDVHITGFSVDDMMKNNPYLMKLGVAKTAMYSKMMEKTRNSMPYSDGAGYVDKEGNLPMYHNMYAQIAQKFDETRRVYKAHLNIQNAMR